MTEELKTLLRKAFDEGAMYEATLSEACSFTNFIKDLESEQLPIHVVVRQSEQFTCDAEKKNQTKCTEQCYWCKTNYR